MLEWMDACVFERMLKWKKGWMLEWNYECLHECCDEWMSAKMNRWILIWINEEEWMSGNWIPES